MVMYILLYREYAQDIIQAHKHKDAMQYITINNTKYISVIIHKFRCNTTAMTQ